MLCWFGQLVFLWPCYLYQDLMVQDPSFICSKQLLGTFSATTAIFQFLLASIIVHLKWGFRVKLGEGVETQFKKGYIYLPFTMMTTCEWNNGPQKHIHDDVWVLLQTLVIIMNNLYEVYFSTVFSMSLLLMLTVNFMTLRVLRSYTRKQNVRYANSNVVKARVERRGMIILVSTHHLSKGLWNINIL